MKKNNNMQTCKGQHSCLNNQGFAISGIMYAILIISLLLVVGTLKTLQNRKTIIDKVKLETVNAVDSNNYQQLLSKVEQLENGIVDKIYPVGSIYISMVNNKTPSELFGGTWEQIGQGRTLIGAGTNGGYTFTSGSTGTTVGATTNPLGEYLHTLSVDEMPTHVHNFRSYYKNTTYNVADGPILFGSTVQPSNDSGEQSALTPYNNYNGSQYTMTILPNGGSQSHNNVQPYIVTYMWKRIS